MRTITTEGDHAATMPAVLPGDPATGWRMWLAPRPFHVVSSLCYLLILVFLIGDARHLDQVRIAYAGAAAILGLLTIDRLEYWYWGETPPRSVAGLLLLVRLIVIEQIDHLPQDQWLGLALYFALPFTASFAFGARGSLVVGAGIWLLLVGKLGYTLLSAPAWARLQSNYLDDLLWVSTMVLFVVTMVRIASQEKSHRVAAEGMLHQLQRAHAQLQAYAAQALQSTEDRNRVAREIHATLGRHLAAIGDRLQQAVALRATDPAGADQAVREAKHTGSDALRDVRQSVAVLRNPATLALPVGPVDPPRPLPASRRSPFSWLAPRPFDVVLSAIYFSLLLGFLDTQWRSGAVWVWQNLVATSAILAMLAVDRWEYWRWGDQALARATITLLVLRIVAIAAWGAAAGQEWSVVPVLLVPHFAFQYWGGRGGLGVALLAWSAFLVIFSLMIIDEPADASFVVLQFVVMSLILGLNLITSWTVSRERQGRRRIENLLAELQATHEQLRTSAAHALAAAEDRTRLARDLHDGLGHYLTVVNVQLEKALAFRDREPAAADQAIVDAERLAGEALMDVRDTVDEFDERHELFSLTAALNLLANNIRHAVSVDLRIAGGEDGFSKQTLLVLYRVAQEGLTNIQKHGAASQVRMELCFAPDTARLKIHDNGRGFHPRDVANLPSNRKGSFGLMGMRERVETVGGTLEITSAPGAGTTLRVVAPRDPLAHSR